MKIIGLAAALALLTALPFGTLAQGDQPAMAKPAGAMAAESKSAAPMLKMSERKGGTRVDADARECLKFPTNREIHICAEKYLPQR